jgi:hypothetical protein
MYVGMGEPKFFVGWVEGQNGMIFLNYLMPFNPTKRLGPSLRRRMFFPPKQSLQCIELASQSGKAPACSQ